MIKKFIILSWLFIGFLIFIGLNFQHDTATDKDEEIRDHYTYIKSAILEQRLWRFRKIVDKRRACNRQELAENKDLYCLEDYINAVFRVTRSAYGNLPGRTRFIQCLKNCPEINRLCQAESAIQEEDDLLQDCGDIEATCLELCATELGKKTDNSYRRPVW